MSLRVGIFGGTFDPVHYGHLRMAEEARDQFGLGKVLFIPNHVSPFKDQETVTPGETRAEMVRCAIAENPFFALSTIELDRIGVSYTVDTLRELKRIEPGSDLFFLTGTDAVRDIAKWREPDVLLSLAQVIAATRPGVDRAAVLQALPPGFAERITFMEMPGLDISATDLRGRVRSNHSIRYLTPPSVEQFIREKGLYLEGTVPDAVRRNQ